MEYFSFLLYTILFITITVPVAIVIFDFFDIKFTTYGNYLLWIIALALFNALLPYKQKSIFEDVVVNGAKKISTAIVGNQSQLPVFTSNTKYNVIINKKLNSLYR